MNFSYRHTQVGYLMIAVLCSGVFGLSASLAFGSGPKVLVVAIATLGLCLLLFPTLTTVVHGDRLRCFFGLGLIRREIPVTEILAVSMVRNPWTYGWGLRLIPGGWLWNVSGLDAIELRRRSGKLFRIGTDEPVALHAAITNAMKTCLPARFIVILSHLPAPEDTLLEIQDYVRDGRAFIPIFDSAQALQSAGGAAGKPVFEIERSLFVSMLKGSETVVLNPSLKSELTFDASDLQRAFPAPPAVATA